MAHRGGQSHLWAGPRSPLRLPSHSASSASALPSSFSFLLLLLPSVSILPAPPADSSTKTAFSPSLHPAVRGLAASLHRPIPPTKRRSEPDPPLSTPPAHEHLFLERFDFPTLPVCESAAVRTAQCSSTPRPEMADGSMTGPRRISERRDGNQILVSEPHVTTPPNSL